ncbi:hypothetical protein [Parasedimentitalea psychrophila]|uniref:Lipoprotein n=1 Tax=Parasedimentitalea psychrophila TaxID=2997337 RepID=A0A9Y2L2U5_9RHOB|nr:hypothetical protein [Parasedimentitalea psychrophila]WIY26547.1 hypothetical protein QPJ95_06410 [Parasedimentitalea psychrophila]
MKGRHLLAVVLLGLAVACTPVVRPSAEVVSQRLTEPDLDVQAYQQWLLRRGYRRLDREDEAGPWPTTGPCFEKTRGNMLAGAVLVRVCFADDEHPIVLSGVSLGFRWTEVYPVDMRTSGDQEGSDFRVLSETLETMTK